MIYTKRLAAGKHSTHKALLFLTSLRMARKSSHAVVLQLGFEENKLNFRRELEIQQGRVVALLKKRSYWMKMKGNGKHGNNA